MTCRCDFCCCPHQTYLQIFHNKGISRRLLNIHSLPATLSWGKRWKEMSLLDEYRNSQGHSGTQQQNSAKQPLPMPAKPRSRWGFRWPWIESIVASTCRRSVVFDCYVTWRWMATWVSVMTKMMPLYNFTITFHGRRAWKTSQSARASRGSRFWLVESIIFGDHVSLRLHW